MFARNRNCRSKVVRPNRNSTLSLERSCQSFGTGKSREIISNGEDKADSGTKVKNCRTSPRGQGSCKETVGNNSRGATTGEENSEH
jgi:hypothetical protein